MNSSRLARETGRHPPEDSAENYVAIFTGQDGHVVVTIVAICQNLTTIGYDTLFVCFVVKTSNNHKHIFARKRTPLSYNICHSLPRRPASFSTWHLLSGNFSNYRDAHLELSVRACRHPPSSSTRQGYVLPVEYSITFRILLRLHECLRNSALRLRRSRLPSWLANVMFEFLCLCSRQPH